jgi:hypothetical protein
MPLKIISSGQTGIDRMARETALELGLETGEGQVSDADATVLYGDPESPGAKGIIENCLRASKPYLINPIPDELDAFIRELRVQVLHVTGDSGSRIAPEFLDAYRTGFRQALLAFV